MREDDHVTKWRPNWKSPSRPRCLVQLRSKAFEEGSSSWSALAYSTMNDAFCAAMKAAAMRPKKVA